MSGPQTSWNGSPRTRNCQRLCALVPTSVPKDPAACQTVLHPKKDVFLLKVAKVGPTGDRRCKMELELVTPVYTGGRKKLPFRIDTRETQCEEKTCECQCSCEVNRKKNRKL